MEPVGILSFEGTLTETTDVKGYLFENLFYHSLRLVFSSPIVQLTVYDDTSLYFVLSTGDPNTVPPTVSIRPSKTLKREYIVVITIAQGYRSRGAW